MAVAVLDQMFAGFPSPTWRIYRETLYLVWGKTACGRDGYIREDHPHQDCIEDRYNHYNLAFLERCRGSRPVVDVAAGLREYGNFIASRFFTVANQDGRYTTKYHWKEINSFCSRKSLNPGTTPRLFEPLGAEHAQPGTSPVHSAAMIEYLYGRVIPTLDRMEEEGWKVESLALRFKAIGHLSYELIATAMEVNVTTVTNWISRGRGELVRRCPEIAKHIGWEQRPRMVAHRSPVRPSEIPPADLSPEDYFGEGIA